MNLMMVNYNGVYIPVEEALKMKAKFIQNEQRLRGETPAEAVSAVPTEKTGAGYDISEEKSDNIDALRAKLDAKGIKYHHMNNEVTLKSILEKHLETEKHLEQTAKPGELKGSDK